MDQRTRKLMTMHKALHPRDDVNRLYVSRKERGRGLVALKTVLTHRYNDLKTTYKGADEYWSQPLETIQRHENLRTEITRKQKWEEKQLNGRFKRPRSDISIEKMCTWLRKGNHLRETESLLIATRNNTIRTNHIKARIDKTQQNNRCRLYGDRDETINHITSECNKLAQKKYKTRHNWLG